MRRPIIAGNWKMFNTITEALELANGIKRELFDLEDIDIVICPPFTALSEVEEVVRDSNIALGAQDLHWEREGAWTGEVSAGMLKDIGCSYVIIGHSERRQFFGETDETVNKKLKAALKEGLSPIVCVGERIEERRNDKTTAVVQRQIEGALQEISAEDVEKLIFAYEPVWAIGTGINATPEQAQEVHIFIRKLLSRLYSEELADTLRIQYGGSVKPDNIKALMAEGDIDGALVGGASLKVESFVEIARGGK